ncbi:outer membrane beta-barrel family protein [Spirosoma gilvum]
MFTGSVSLAQTTLIGKLISQSGTPISFANVLLLRSSDSTLVKGELSRDDGQFAFEAVKKGDYLLVASQVGFRKAYSSLVSVRTDLSLLQVDPITLQSETKQLQSVTVSAYKPLFEQQADRLVIHVQNSIVSAGGTALDVLERAPGVSLDRQESKLLLNGKASVLVMLNGKLNRMPVDALLQQLAGLPTSFIEKVELITNPPARYDAEGDAGLINIILKKDTGEGLNGTYTLAAGYGFYEKWSGAGMLNYRTRKLALFGDYAYTADHMWQQWVFDWQLQQGAAASRSYTLADREATMPVHTARVGFEYAFTPRWTVAGIVSGFDSRWAMTARTQALFQHQKSDVNSLITTDEVNHWQHLMSNLSLHYQSAKTEITIDVDRLHYANVQPTTYRYQYDLTNTVSATLPQETRIGKKTPFGMWVIKADVSRSLQTGWKIEAGFKSSRLALQNTVFTDQLLPTGWQKDSLYSQQTTMSETILAGYMSLKGQLGKRWQVQGGLRGEATHTLLLANGETQLVNRNYINLFPSIFFTHEISKERSLQLSYSRRITRPPYKVLAPTMIFIGPTTLRTGNPGILPTMSDAVQLNYRFKGAYLLSVRYAFDRNQFFDYQPQLDRSDPQATRQVFNTRNIAQTHSVSASFAFPWSPARWWQSQTQFLGVWQQASTWYEQNFLSFGQVYGQLNTTHTVKLWPGAAAELTAFYNSPSRTMGIFQRRAYGSVTVGLQQKVDKQRGLLRLTLSDLFWTNTRIGDYNLPEEDIRAYTAVTYEPRVIRLSYTYNFGSQSIKGTGKRKTGSEEERERAN